MGTTVTSNLGLIKPDDDESIKANMPTFAGWCAQNTVNMDKIDALFRGSINNYTLNLTAASVNPTLGAGSVLEGKYVRLWPRMIIVFFRIYVGGAGFAAGTGTYRINTPVSTATTLTTANGARPFPVGKSIFHDSSAAATCSAVLVNYDPASDRFVFQLSAGGLLTNTDVGQDDRFAGYCLYPTDTP